jgi:hypothetical protein
MLLWAYLTGTAHLGDKVATSDKMSYNASEIHVC